MCPTKNKGERGGGRKCNTGNLESSGSQRKRKVKGISQMMTMMKGRGSQSRGSGQRAWMAGRSHWSKSEGSRKDFFKEMKLIEYLFIQLGENYGLN